MTVYKHLTLNQFRASPAWRCPLRKDASPLVAPAPAASTSSSVPWCFSTQNIDRAGDRILSWRLGNFKKNPVLCWAHQSDRGPIGRIADIAWSGGRLTGRCEFMSADISDFAGRIARMVAAGWLRSASVGFVPIRWQASKDPKRAAVGGIDFFEAELIEVSICPVPANPEALAETAKAIGPRSPAAARIARARQLARDVAPMLRPTTPPSGSRTPNGS